MSCRIDKFVVWYIQAQPIRFRYLNCACVKHGVIYLIGLYDGTRTDHPKG
jgi:hypothetical protein